jgi:hypothetical protein
MKGRQGIDHCTSLHEASLQIIGNRLSARLFAWPSICPDSVLARHAPSSPSRRQGVLLSPWADYRAQHSILSIRVVLPKTEHLICRSPFWHEPSRTRQERFLEKTVLTNHLSSSLLFVRFRGPRLRQAYRKVPQPWARRRRMWA